MPVDARGNWFAGDTPRSDAAVASAARTATGTSAAFSAADAKSFESTLTVTAVAGTTPTLDVTLETSIDDGSTWDTVGAFTQLTDASADGHVFGPLGDKCRWKWTIGGVNPSFTFSIATEANR